MNKREAGRRGIRYVAGRRGRVVNTDRGRCPSVKVECPLGHHKFEAVVPRTYETEPMTCGRCRLRNRTWSFAGWAKPRELSEG